VKNQNMVCSCGRRAGKATHEERLDAALRELRDCLRERRRLYGVSVGEEALLDVVIRARGEVENNQQEE